MAPLVANSTVRMKQTYVAFGLEHSVTIRYGRGTTGATAQAANAAMLTAVLSGFVSAGVVADDFEWLDAFYSPEDSDDFFPAATTPTDPVGTVDGTTISKIRRITHTRFQGSASGRQGSFELYGITWALDDDSVVAGDGKVTAGENAAVAAAISNLAAGPVAINNAVITWKPHVYVKINDYWLKRLRRGLV